MARRRTLVKAVLGLILILAVGFFGFAPKIVDKRLNEVAKLNHAPVSEQAERLHAELLIGDWHADSLLWQRRLEDHHDYGHVDIPRLQAGNVGLQMFTTVTKSPKGLNIHKNDADAHDDITSLALTQRWPVRTWNSLFERARYQSQRLRETVAANPDDIMLIRSQAELQTFLSRRATQPKLIGALLGTEGSHALDGDLENVQRLFDDGFRMMSLHHFFDNRLGGSLHGVVAAGLTDFGRDVVAKIEALGIVLDVSHSSETVVRDVLAMAQRPLVVSHTGFKGHCNTERNIADDLMQQIAQKGGLIAVGYWRAAVCGVTPDAVADAIVYGVNLVGENHVALGSDFDGSVMTGFDASELVALTDALLSKGLNEAQVRLVMGGNMAAFLARYLPER
ncbi:dipeptidase [Arenicella chitinivorans]|uniref:Dipeptidase n=1 Tax=Arenicella chitinivorans TaxID=1329800 RepID=A0A918S3G3_9GAMM|nr:dipeptidase [Arenicella chitinivorans]GHA19763.1 dipeptidase [Arenicella chitinivorans]